MLAQKFIAILTLALTVSASPLVARQIWGDGEGNQEIGNEGQNSGNWVENSGNIHGDFTVEQSMNTCGNLQLNCCNNIEKKGDTINAGILASLLGSGDVGIQCSPINAAVAGGQAPINKACSQSVACCQGGGSQNGLINVGCIALGSLL